MSDQTPSEQKTPDSTEQKNPAPTAQDRHRRWERSSSQDKFLQLLSRFLEQLYPKAKISIGITLNTGGMLVSGQLISAQWYFEQVREQLTALPPGSLAEPFIKTTELLSEGIKEQLAEEEEKEGAKGGDKEPFIPNFIHLMKAKFYVPGQVGMPAGDGVLWRGRISAVDGLTVGSFSASP